MNYTYIQKNLDLLLGEFLPSRSLKGSFIRLSTDDFNQLEGGGGDINVYTGDSNSNINTSGIINIRSKYNSNSGYSGDILIWIGDETGSNNSINQGSVYFTGGNITGTSSGTSGSIYMSTGNVNNLSATGNAGDFTFRTGQNENAFATPGNIINRLGSKLG